MSTSAPEGPVLSVRGLSKRYAAPVLRGIDLDLWPGEVHALMGANGAGKSTFARILCGLTAADEGALRLDGREFAPSGKAEAEARGVRLVPQEPNLVATLSVGENLFLGALPSRAGLVRREELRQRAREALGLVGLEEIDPDLPAERLGVGQQQLVSIAAALSRPGRLVILDEPTAALTGPQVDRLFGLVEKLKRDGVAVVFVSHRLEELKRISDRVSVLRDGKLVATREAAGFSMDEAVRLMVGEGVGAGSEKAARERGTVALEVKGLTRGTRVRDVSFEVRRGEIFGLSGLVGAGRTELLRAIFGADVADAGTVKLGEREAVRFGSPRQAVRAGLGMIPEDRKREGLLLPLAIGANVTLAKLREFRGPLGSLRRAAEREAAQRLGRVTQLASRGPEQPAEQLSGGNQQKVLLSRWLLADPEVLLLDEPTRGIDVAARQAIHRLIEELAAGGKAIVIASSDEEELMHVCDRIGVVSAGRLVRTLERGEFTREALLSSAFLGYTTKQEPGA